MIASKDDSTWVRTLGVGTRLPDQVDDGTGEQRWSTLLETMLGRYLLDRDGRKIWHLLDGHRTVAGIVEHVASHSDFDPEDVEEPVRAFLERLGELGLAHREPGADSASPQQ